MRSRSRAIAARAVAPREGAGEQIFLDRQMAEAVAALHHLDGAAAHQFVRRGTIDALALEQDLALGDLAALRPQEIGDRLQRRRLARAIGAEQRDDAAPPQAERDALQHEGDAVVDDLYIADFEDGGGHERLPDTPSPALAGEGRGEGGGNYDHPHPALRATFSARAEQGHDLLSQGSVRAGQPAFFSA